MTVATLIIAIIGAVTGITSLCWNIASWQRSGPVIEVQVTCSGRGDEMKISGIVKNTGRFDGYLVAAWFGFWVRRKWLDIELPADRIDGLEIPGSLSAQKHAEFKIAKIADVDPGLSAALHERREVWLLISTGSGKRAESKVLYT
jgi:hypothetical protein